MSGCCCACLLSESREGSTERGQMPRDESDFYIHTGGSLAGGNAHSCATCTEIYVNHLKVLMCTCGRPLN